MGEFEDFVREEYRRREQVVSSHFTREAPRLARACHAMAERFARGGRILAFGLGAAATDASHISVEFVHPVIVGKRASDFELCDQHAFGLIPFRVVREHDLSAGREPTVNFILQKLFAPIRVQVGSQLATDHSFLAGKANRQRAIHGSLVGKLQPGYTLKIRLLVGGRRTVG